MQRRLYYCINDAENRILHQPYQSICHKGNRDLLHMQLLYLVCRIRIKIAPLYVCTAQISLLQGMPRYTMARGSIDCYCIEFICAVIIVS